MSSRVLIERVGIVIADAAGVALMKVFRECRRFRQWIVGVEETEPTDRVTLWERIEITRVWEELPDSLNTTGRKSTLLAHKQGRMRRFAMDRANAV